MSGLEGLGKRVLVMGILNVTPDSFSDGGAHISCENAVDHAIKMAGDGADIIDIGGESSRPGSDPVPQDIELERVIPVIQALADSVDIDISIDTYKPQVAKQALQAGATMINDITGLDQDMADVAAEFKVPAVMMHMRDKPKTMQQDIVYEDIIKEIKTFFTARLKIARQAGVKDIILDPGIGFGKNLEHNLAIISRLEEFADLGCPLLMGPSRKSFIGELLDLPIKDRLEGSLAAVTACVLNGTDIIRIHDVRQCSRAVRVAQAIRDSR